MATKLLYMEDFDVTNCTATVTDIKPTDSGQIAVVLDQTCFYPRGGGQDWDTGVMVSDSGEQYEVSEVRLDEDGVVQHIGSGGLTVGDAVTCQVDKKRRQDNTRLHSAGHIIDMAVSQLGYDWIPGRGAHYPHMSFVEYTGAATESAMSEIQAKVDEITSNDVANTLKFVDHKELAKLCRHVPGNLPTNKPTRVVLYGDFGVPCGGTHVRTRSEIGKIEVTKVKTKKGLTKVSYRVEGVN